MINRKLVSVFSYLLKFDFIQFRFYPLKKKVKVDKIEELLYLKNSSDASQTYFIDFIKDKNIYNTIQITPGNLA